MNKGLITAAVAILGLSGSLPASASLFNFTGPFAPANWTTTITGTVDGGGAENGNVNTSGAPPSITINGGDDPSFATGCPGGVTGVAGPCDIAFTIAHSPIVYTFTWSYTTNDITPQYDQFGVVVDGVMTELVANAGPLTQSGTFSVKANSTFGWYINCTDCVGGNASATITNFGVPEPATLALVGLGLQGLRRGRRQLDA